MDITTLADIGQIGSEPAPRSRITVARLGKYSDPRYGKFEIGEADFEGWQRNLASTFGGKVAVDWDHSSDRGRGTEASAWITALERQGKDVIADVEWTPRGAAAIRDKSYQFISPTYTEHYKDETGTDRGRALIGAALTNRPVLRQLPTLSLSREDIPDVATPTSSKRERKRARQLAKTLAAESPSPRDSRGQMDLKALAKTLDLPEDSDEPTILAKVTELKEAKPPEATPSPGDAGKSTETEDKSKQLTRTNEDGTISLSADAYAQLLSGANAGAAAAKMLAEQTFTHAWEKALSEGRAAPAQQETVKALFELDPELAVKTLDSFVPIVPVKPTGSGEGPAEAPDGMDPERYQLHIEAKALAAKKLEATPSLDPGEAYILATQEIEERKFTLEHPGI